jgi:hypothetical protein
LPQFRDRLREVVLLDNRIGPNGFHDSLLIEDSIVVFDHEEQRFEHSRREGNRCSIQTTQLPFRRVKLESAKFVEVRRGSVHHRFQNNSEKFSCRLKTFISAPGIFHRGKFGSDRTCAQPIKNPQKQ